MTPRAFARNLAALMTHEGFPPPYIGTLDNGRTGPRRRWLAAAVHHWIENRSAPGVETAHEAPQQYPLKSAPQTAPQTASQAAPLAANDGGTGQLIDYGAH